MKHLLLFFLLTSCFVIHLFVKISLNFEESLGRELKNGMLLLLLRFRRCIGAGAGAGAGVSNDFLCHMSASSSKESCNLPLLLNASFFEMKHRNMFHFASSASSM